MDKTYIEGEQFKDTNFSESGKNMELKHRIVTTLPLTIIWNDLFPDNFAYVASEWQANDRIPIILLEKFH